MFSFEVRADSTLSAAEWNILILNAASLPADGPVTPVKCYGISSGTIQAGGTFAGTGVSFPIGMVIVVSTNTSCFTLAASVHAFISGDAQ